MVPRLHLSNGYIKRKLRIWRGQKCISYSVQKQYLSVRGHKLPLFMGGSIRPRMEICETSSLPIGMVQRFHSRNVYIKRNLREPKNVLLLSVENPIYLCRVCKLPHFMSGSMGLRMEICEISGLPVPMVPHLLQSNGYIKRKLWVWRAHKCIVLVGAETVRTSAGPQTTLFFGWQYGA